MNEPPNEDRNWTVCSDSDDVDIDLPQAELEAAEDCEWSICAEEPENDRCTEAMDYVNQLIARMNGNDETTNVTPSVPSPPKPAAPVNKPELPKKTEQRPAASRSPMAPRQKSPEPPAEPVEKETAEEKQMRIAHRPLVMAADMQRLREAANLSMSGMLKSLDQKYLMRQAYTYLVASGGLVATSMVLLSMSPRISSLSYVASAISTVVAGVTAWKFTKVARRLADVVRSDQRLA